MAMPPMMKGILVRPMYKLPTAPLTKPAQGPAKSPQRKTPSWKKCTDEVNPGRASGMASGGTDSMLAKAAMRAVNAMVLALTIRVPLCPWFVFQGSARLF